uniref:GAG-pre-integrase domain-containing protein n=1 Tax=Triticum urartu TaxID=4572 RepID=A0A8R7QU66_TRIUA
MAMNKSTLQTEKGTRKTLLRGRCRHGLYPLSSAPLSSNKQAFGVNKLPTERWHSRLGHPSSTIVRHVLSQNNIPFSSSELNKEGVCDA